MMAPPNKRLKLAGLSLSKESEGLCTWRALTLVQYACAGGLAARSLSAIR